MVAWQHAAGWLTGAILLGMSRYEAAPERESSRTVVVVLLSLLILTIIGALMGYILGKRDIEDDKSSVGDGKSPTKVATSSRAAEAEECPGFIGVGVQAKDRNAALPLRVVLYIRTDKSEVWICREDDGTGLWYQGHDKQRGFYYTDGEIPVSDVNGLLLSGVTQNGETFVARNNGTTYQVSRKELKVSGGQNFTAAAVEARP
ncbi:hypothetical protein GCM10010399_06140 [Dactylosporangium fulvum]